LTCGKVVASKSDEFNARVAKGEDAATVLDSFGFDRYCCRRMLLGNANLIDEILPYARY
jgi:DNA-directed RNA polymerase subunit N